jgi:glycosyltransferase involved in cell wall biosynthesis
MAQDPLHVLWIEPNFPGRLGAVADWLVRRRGYRCSFYAHSTGPRSHWPESVGKGLDLQLFGVGGVAKERAVTWARALERSLCYAYGCWEVLEQRRPKPIDLFVGRSAGLGSSLFASAYRPAPIVSYLDYYYHAHAHDLADEAGPDTPTTYFHWRQSTAAIELLDLEQATQGWVPTRWQRDLFPAEYRDSFLVQHEGIDTERFARSAWHSKGDGPRSIAGRVVPKGTRVVSFVARSVDRLRGFDRFMTVASALLKARTDVVCVVAGDPIVSRGLDVAFHNKDYSAHLMEQEPPHDRDRLWLLNYVTPAAVAELLAKSDLHIAPGRAYPVARSLVEAMSAGCVVVASDTAPHREVLSADQNGLLVDARDTDAMIRAALAVLADPAAFRPLGDAASAFVAEHWGHEVCVPRLAEAFSALVANARAQA